MSTDADIPIEVLRRYGLSPTQPTLLDNGLINQTWLLDAKGTRYILQRVNPMFGPEVHQDIATVTTHLYQKGIMVPRLIPADDGCHYVRDKDAVWRLYDYLAGVSFNTVRSPAIAFEAGATLARFHQGLLDLDYCFKNRRRGVHDTRQHIQNLQTSLESKQDHPRFMDVLPLATEILTTISQVPGLPDLPPRKVHGDPKISNFLFQKETGKGLSMLDFDTLGEMSLALELGDAMRSWCNPAGENT
ncbi:MAG: phosphotransferase, partial [Gammaproteobacteria bacterium]